MKHQGMNIRLTPPGRLGQRLLALCVALGSGAVLGGEELTGDHQPPGWRMLAEKAAFCPVAELETCLEDNGGPLLGLLDFYRRMPERFWVGWNEACVRPPFSVPELSPVPLGAKAGEAISSSHSIITGRVREVTVGFFAPNVTDPTTAVRVYTMIRLEDMDVLKHTRLILGAADSSPNPLQPGHFVLLAPVGSARLGEVEFCSRDRANTPPFDVLVPGDQLLLFSRDGLIPAAWGPGALFAETWTPGELAVFDASGTKKFNTPALEEHEKAEGASDFEALIGLVAKSGEDR